MKQLKKSLHWTIGMISTYWYLLVLISVAAILRLYRIRDYVVFLGDEGRDALVWHHMVTQGKFTFLGPTASVGGFYLGPIYYYLALPFYWIWRDPVGPAIFVALVGIATVGLVYYAGKRWFGEIAGLVGAWIYAISALVVRYSRASWNPNPLPFFSLLGVVLLWDRTSRWKWVKSIGAGLCLGIALQLHYLAAILVPIYVLVILAMNFLEKEKQDLGQKIGRVICEILLLTVGWAIGFSPFLVFEIYHHFPNTRTIFEFLTRRESVLDFHLVGLIRSILRHANELFFHTFLWQDGPVSKIISAVVVVAGSIIAAKKRQWGFLIWFFLGLLIFSLYQGSISDYYFGFLFPAPALFLGAIGATIWEKRDGGKPLVLLLIFLLLLDQVGRWPTSHTPNLMLEQTQRVALKILEFSGGRDFNFALITGGNSDHAYRYFLERMNRTPKTLEQEVTDQLLVVCEKPKEDCQPLGNPVWEVAGFGRAEISREESVPPGLTVFRLIHHESSMDLIGKPAAH